MVHCVRNQDIISQTTDQKQIENSINVNVKYKFELCDCTLILQQDANQRHCKNVHLTTIEFDDDVLWLIYFERGIDVDDLIWIYWKQIFIGEDDMKLIRFPYQLFWTSIDVRPFPTNSNKK